MSTSHLGPVLILCQDPFPCMDTVLCQGAGGGQLLSALFLELPQGLS